MTANKLLSRTARRKKTVETALLGFFEWLRWKVYIFQVNHQTESLSCFPALIRTWALEAVDFFGSKEMLQKHGFALVARAIILHDTVSLHFSERILTKSLGSMFWNSTLPATQQWQIAQSLEFDLQLLYLWNLGEEMNLFFSSLISGGHLYENY